LKSGLHKRTKQKQRVLFCLPVPYLIWVVSVGVQYVKKDTNDKGDFLWSSYHWQSC